MKERPEGILFGTEITGYRKESCEICVIGSGPGGAAAAEVLARAGHDVLMIEEGPIPEKGARLTPQKAMQRYYRDSGFFATLWPVQVPIPTGRVFGGTSVINSGTCFHTPERLFDRWERDLGVAFDRKAWREVEGELDEDLHVSPCPVERMSPSDRIFAEGLERLGLSGGKPLSRCEDGCDGQGLCCFVCPNEAKQAMHLNLLPRALPQGMRAIVETRALGLIHDGARVTGVVCQTSAGARLVVRAKRFILAMGALETPDFLLKSGFRRRYPAIGRNLAIHPASKVLAEMPESIGAWKGVPQAYCYEHPDYPDVHFEGIFLPPSLGSASIPFLGSDLCDWMGVYDRLSAFGFYVSDSQYGRLIRMPGMRPLIRYTLTEKDLDGFYFAIKTVARAHFAMGAKRVLLPIADPSDVCSSEDELEQRFRRENMHPKRVYSMAFHPLGTCRFAGSLDKGVVDQFGRCHRHDNVFICDGSAVAGPLGVNPQITIMAFSRLAARHMA